MSDAIVWRMRLLDHDQLASALASLERRVSDLAQHIADTNTGCAGLTTRLTALEQKAQGGEQPAATSCEGERTCGTCRHYDLPLRAEPCASCFNDPGDVDHPSWEPAPSASEAECSHSSAVADSKRGWVCDYCRKELGFTLSGVPCPPEPTPQASEEAETKEIYMNEIEEYEALRRDGLSDDEARGTVWPDVDRINAIKEAETFAHDVAAATHRGAMSGAPTPGYMGEAIALVLARDSRIASEAREKAIEEAAVLVEAHPAVFYPDGAHDVAKAIRALSPSTSKAEATKEASMPQAGESPVPSRRSEPAGGISPSTSEGGEVKP